MSERETQRPTWQTIGWQQDALVDSTGRIIGRVDGGYRCWHAHADVRPLGTYIDRESAQRAVEAAVLPFASSFVAPP